MPDKELVFKVDKVVETKNDDLEKADRVVTTLVPVGDTKTKLKFTITETTGPEGRAMFDDIGVNLGVGDEVKVIFKGYKKQTTLPTP